MSKKVKDLITGDLKNRLEGVEDAVLVNVIGMDANSTVKLRKELRTKGISLMVVKTSLGARATEGTSLHAAFEGAAGTLAMVWGGEDFVSLVKEVVELDKGEEYELFEARGGVMDGEHLTADRVREISKWPNRQEQLSILMGQVLGPGSTLSAQLLGPGAALASQVKQKSEGDEE